MEDGISRGYGNGYDEGYSKGKADALTEEMANPDLPLVFDRENLNLWKWINIISIALIGLSLLISIGVVIMSESQSQQAFAKSLVVFVALLVSYLVFPKINYRWFVNPNISSSKIIAIYLMTTVLIFLIGMKLSDVFRAEGSVVWEIAIVFILSSFLCFLGYLILNKQYFFGDTPFFGNTLLVFMAVGALSSAVYSLLKSQSNN